MLLSFQENKTKRCSSTGQLSSEMGNQSRVSVERAGVVWWEPQRKTSRVGGVTSISLVKNRTESDPAGDGHRS